MEQLVQMDLFTLLGVELQKPAKKVIQKRKAETSKMDILYKKYQGVVLEDAGSILSNDFKSFSRAVKAAWNELCGQMDAELVAYYNGHYYMSGFIKKGERVLYVSYSEPRWSPINLDESGVNGILIRAAKHEKDYGGSHSHNHFCSFRNMKQEAERILSSTWEYSWEKQEQH